MKVPYSSYKVVFIKVLRNNLLMKNLAQSLFGSALYISNHFKQRLHYPTGSEFYRACSALIIE